MENNGRSVSNKELFGLCDDTPPARNPAYIDEADKSKWIGIVDNPDSKPKGFYGLSYLENKNVFFVANWNIRVNQPQRYNRNLYQLKIDYEPNIRYGYEVNYLLYNYFVYFEKVNRVKL